VSDKSQCPRLAAARCLAGVSADGLSLSRQLPIFERDLPAEQRPLYRELCYGTLREFWRLEAALRPMFSKPLKSRDCDVKMLVYVGTYQLLNTRIPEHAAINSCVEACRKLKKKWATGLVNAILRRVQRERDSLFEHLPPAARNGFPEWLYKAVLEAWPGDAANIFSASNQHPPFCLRVNRRHGSREAYIERLSEQGINAQACDFAPQGLRLDQACPVNQLPGFSEGDVSVQDEAAQLCCELLDLHANQRVLDACAAPGGKTCAILEAEPALAELVAVELDAARMDRIEDNLARLGLSAALHCADVGDVSSWWDGQVFDRILLDAPCSATGVIRRNPDIRLHRRAEDIASLAQLQGELLDALWPTLRPGGLLLYATCSILPAENEAVVSAFVGRQTDARTLPIDAGYGIDRAGARQLFPQASGHDGFFYCLLQKA
jgi:16S rRNA (cytosine967-C5)-methyltransferase